MLDTVESEKFGEAIHNLEGGIAFAENRVDILEAIADRPECDRLSPGIVMTVALDLRRELDAIEDYRRALFDLYIRVRKLPSEEEEMTEGAA